MPETEAEVMQILHQGILAGHTARKSVILVDGQPRNLSQLAYFRQTWTPSYVRYISLWASREVRETRARARDADPVALKLSLDRMDSELKNFIDVHMAIEAFGTQVRVFDTSMRSPNLEDIL
jgi:hypothetical protein